MPQVFKIGPWLVYFWLNESEPLEPVHVHVAQKQPEKDATKIWITKAGGAVLCHNKSQIPNPTLHNIMDLIALRSDYIVVRWTQKFGECRFYC